VLAGGTKVSSAANGQNSTHLAAALHCVSVMFLPNTPYMPRHGRRQNTNGTRSLQCAPPPPHKGCHRISPSPPLSQNGAPHPFFLLQCEVEIPLMSSRLWLRPTTRRSLQSKLPGFFPTKMAGLQSLFYFLSGRLPVGKLKRGHRPFERTQKHNHFNLNFFRHRCVEEIPGSWELRTCSHYLRQWVARMRPHPGLIHYLPHSFGTCTLAQPADGVNLVCIPQRLA
jgi:hypothetical protein